MEHGKVFVTGGGGLVGSHLIVALLRKGYEIVALMRDPSKTKLINHIAGLYFPEEKIPFENLQAIQGDMLNRADVYETMAGCDYVYHCAAMVSFVPAHRDRMIQNNVDGTAILIDAALKHKIQKFCQVSSIAALGSGDAGERIDENTARNPGGNFSGYSISKFYSELEVWRGFHEGLPVVIVNPAIILGPGEWTKGSATLIHQVYKGMPFYTDGIGSYVDVRDVVEMMIGLMESSVSGERYCLSPHELAYREMFTKLALLFGKKPPHIRISYPVLRMISLLAAGISRISRKDPLITKETASSAFSKHSYDSQKIIRELNVSFRPLDDTLDYCTQAYLSDIREK